MEYIMACNGLKQWETLMLESRNRHGKSSRIRGDVAREQDVVSGVFI